MRYIRSALLLAAALLVAAAAGTDAIAQTNMLANPGFEDGGGSYDGWFTFGAGVQLSTPGTDNIIRTGAAASKVYGEFTGCPVPNFDVGGFGQAFTPIAGRIYELGGYSFVSSADVIPGTNSCDFNRMIAKIVFFDAPAGGNEIAGNEILIGDFDTPLDQWIEFSVSLPAPAAAQRVEALFLFLQPGCDTGSVFVDDAWFYEYDEAPPANILANPSLTGNLVGWSTFGNVYYDGRSWAYRTPTGCAKLFSTFTPDSPSGMYQLFAADPGSIWKMGAWSLVTCRESPIYAGNDNFVTATLSFFDVDTVLIDAQEVVVADSLSPLGTWTHHELKAAAPAGTVYVGAYILFISPTLQGGAAWVDDLSLWQIGMTDADPTPPAATPALRQNVPNPFNPSTRIDFELARAGVVDLSVYDVTGRLVATLVSGRLEAGMHESTWNGMTAGGAKAASGVYLYVLKTEDGQESRRMVLLR
ncbi:MAG: FlgD immunoglobulin-like domain containing protein [Candidatus Krumholzibacteria bacterium]|nr:FlgD immunoglobulin-like domain containing protein [Candidatus Krumholzibacteria bacterium]